MAPALTSPLTPDQCTALELVSALKFHQSFTIPATDTHGPLQVTFAIAGPPIGKDPGKDPNEIPTILWCGPDFGLRWDAFIWNHMAEKMGVRFLVLDRPGYGGSTHVPLEQRISVFIETVPLLLKHLNISHIHLASHSAGTIYALNLLGSLPDILCPINPTITMFAPWIHQSHTGNSFFLRTVALLPNKLFDKWSSIVMLFSKTCEKFRPTLKRLKFHFKKRSTLSKERMVTDAKWQQSFGCTKSVWKETFKLIGIFIQEEAVRGLNDEIKLCLKTSRNKCSWGFCEDYQEMAKALCRMYDKREQEGKGRLNIQVFFAEDDCFIGNKGKEYWVELWREANCGHGLQIDCTESKGTYHGSVVNVRNFKWMFEKVKSQVGNETSVSSGIS